MQRKGAVHVFRKFLNLTVGNKIWCMNSLQAAWCAKETLEDGGYASMEKVRIGSAVQEGCPEAVMSFVRRGPALAICPFKLH
jgi:hypothetical protein